MLRYLPDDRGHCQKYSRLRLRNIGALPWRRASGSGDEACGHSVERGSLDGQSQRFGWRLAGVALVARTPGADRASATGAGQLRRCASSRRVCRWRSMYTGNPRSPSRAELSISPLDFRGVDALIACSQAVASAFLDFILKSSTRASRPARIRPRRCPP